MLKFQPCLSSYYDVIVDLLFYLFHLVLEDVNEVFEVFFSSYLIVVLTLCHIGYLALLSSQEINVVLAYCTKRE